MTTRFRTRIWPLALAALSAGALLAACTSREEKELGSYINAMAEYESTTKNVIRDFNRVREGVEPKAANKTIEEQVIPAAEEIRKNLEAISPKSKKIRELHENAVACWKYRIEGYGQALEKFKGNREMAEAMMKSFGKGDLQMKVWYDGIMAMAREAGISYDQALAEPIAKIKLMTERTQTGGDLPDKIPDFMMGKKKK